jgi:hypothetical protein
MRGYALYSVLVLVVAHVAWHAAYGAQRSELYGAAGAGDLAAVTALLKGGASPHVGWTAGPHGWFVSVTPLLAAARYGAADVVAALLTAGASADAGFGVGPLGCFASQTPLSAAAEVRGATRLSVLCAFVALVPTLRRCCFRWGTCMW